MSDDVEIRRRVLTANLDLVRLGLVIFTWGNASAVDRERGLMYIKPSGVDYARMTPDDIVPVRLADGTVASGNLRPSSDTPTHLALYRAWPRVGGIVHTHSEYATAIAQAGVPIPAQGSTHADYFHGDVPVTRGLTRSEVEGDYESRTGDVIIERFVQGQMDPIAVPGVLVDQHGPFSWGVTVEQAVMHAGTMEHLSKMFVHAAAVAPRLRRVPRYLLDKHYQRKHGPKAYYGQKPG
ncbi:MAG: L-ribulose-5-phosphate 4-epimerase AraD [Planctomycetes bacterium]|nr:L-ribulose-5-phosphate 4-epimerase AraD [Planctomycetota bacterium]